MSNLAVMQTLIKRLQNEIHDLSESEYTKLALLAYNFRDNKKSIVTDAIRKIKIKNRYGASNYFNFDNYIMLQIEHISKEKPELSNYEYIVLAAKEWLITKK